MLENQRILITGPTSQVAFPIARELAERNDVIGLARFADDASRARVERCGVRCIAVDLASGDFSEVPEDVDYVLSFAVVKSFDGSFEYDLAANVEGVGHLMSRCRGAKAFLHCSSTAVYEAAGRREHREGDPLGDNHRALMPTYSICKIAAESMVRFGARQWNLPSTIARMNVPYGDNGGWPAYHVDMILGGVTIELHADKPSVFNPIHEDDYIAHIPRLLEIASVPATTVNWGGSEAVSIEQWCTYIGDLVGVEPKLEYTERALSSVTV
ncbi:MAG: NAD(P)-dependent oxidoreductase, partial [Pseudomonadales bacterium]|nr:NAD(P)-dependent oxidoreductase [Pseudomonadales bacterium]